MAWVIFEIFLVLCLATFIVWWTLPKSTKKLAKKVDEPATNSSQSKDQQNGHSD